MVILFIHWDLFGWDYNTPYKQPAMHPPPRLRPRSLHSSTIIASYFVSAALYRSTRSIRLLRMLPRTLRHSRSAPALRGAISPAQHPSQAHLHTSSSALKSAAPAPPGTPTSPTKSWRERTVVELRAELKRRGLPTTGKKDDVSILLPLLPQQLRRIKLMR